MKFQSLMFLTFILITIPLVILITSHNIFFIIVGTILFLNCTKNIYRSIIINTPIIIIEDEENNLNDLEELINLDIKKLEKGTKIVKSLISILFFIYCSIYLSNLLLKITTAFLITFYIKNIIDVLKNNENIKITYKNGLTKIIEFLLNFSTIFIFLYMIYTLYFFS